MKLENSIGWCDATTNAVTGCKKVSLGCKNCFAELGTAARVLRGKGIETWGAKGVRQPVNFEPVFRRLNKLCICDKCHETWSINNILCDAGSFGLISSCTCGGKLRRIRLFADSNSDWLDPKWPVETLAKFLDAIRLAPNVDVQLLTKRIELWQQRMNEVVQYCLELGNANHDLEMWLYNWLNNDEAPENLWLGVSVENQKYADERIPLLLKTPAAVRFLSVEPLLENVDLGKAVRLAGFDKDANGNRKNHEPAFDWVIVGGESGKNRRDCGVNAIERVVEQCVHAGVPVYCKQDSHLFPGQQGRLTEAFWKRKEFPR